MANTIMTLLVEIGASTSGLVKELKGAESQSKKTASSILKTIAPTLTGYASVAGAIGAVTTALKFSVQQAAESQRVQAQLNAVLKSTGGAAGMSAEEIDKLSLNLSRMSTYDDEAVKSSSALLLTFTAISRDVFPEAQQAILDMSAALGQDLQSSTIQLGKALNDPIKGVTALQRVGVSFTETQKKMIEGMVKSGQVMEAQKYILAEINREFGGSAAAAANTYQGQISQLKNEFGNLGEVIGQDLLPQLTQATTDLKDFTIWVTNNYEEIKEWGNRISWVVGFMPRLGVETGKAIRSFFGLDDATKETKEELTELPPVTEEVASSLDEMGKQADETAKIMTARYKEIAKSAQDIIKSNRDYKKDLESIASDEKEVAQERMRLEFEIAEIRRNADRETKDAKTWKEKAKIQDALEMKERDYIEKFIDNENKAKDIEEKRLEVDREKLEADAQKKYNLLEQRALIDGIISSGENEWLLEQAENLGLITPAARDAAIAQSQWADAMYASFAETQPGMEETLRLMQEMYAYDGKTVNFGVNFQSNRPSYSGGYSATSTTIGSGVSNSQAAAAEFMSNLLNNNPGWRDSGGTGFAGKPYMIGTGAQPEMFVPNSNGTFIPNADKKLGSTYNINIYNPVPTKSEESVRRALKSLSYTGAIQA